MNTFWNYRYIYWHQNLRSAEPQQVLFAMVLNSPYVRQPGIPRSIF